MALKPDLEDLQLILLTSAAKTEAGLILPAPAHIAQYKTHVLEATGILVDRGLADEILVEDPAMSWRAEDDKMFGACINDSGREAAEINGPAPDQPEMKASRRNRGKKSATETPPALPKKKPGDKQAKVIQLLQRKIGASLQEIIDATGWLPHSARAVLSGLRKQGHNVERTKTTKGSVYRITKAS